MKLERVALRSFLSHHDTDWAPNGARLVALVGANGAGKSSLLDALAFALYDSARGRTDDLVQLGATDMSARVEFTFAGARYAVERGRTRRAGGKSYLEFQVQDGASWRPLTGDSIRETQERIAELLRMDAATFTSAALLMQGRLNAFTEATAAERKRILVQVLGLEVYGRAEQAARARARDLQARNGAETDQLLRMDQSLAERPERERDLEYSRRAEADATAARETSTAARDALRARLAEFDARVAQADAQARLVAELRSRVVTLATAYNDAKGRRVAAELAIGRATTAIDAGEAAQAEAEGLEAAAAELARLEGILAEIQTSDRAITQRRRDLDARAAEHRTAVATWKAEYSAARRRVDELTSAAAALKTIPCPRCGAAVTPDGGDLVARQSAAKVEFARLEGTEPKASISIVREEAEIRMAVERLARRQEEIADLPAARAEVIRLTTIAARAEGLEDARHNLALAESAAAAAQAEMDTVTEQGRAAKAAVDAAAAELEALRATLTGREAVAEEFAVADRAATIDEALLRREQGKVAAAAAALEQLDQLAEDRKALAAKVAEAQGEIDVLTRLAGAFGVNGIPARIIESTIPELEAHANALLEDLRPGMTLAIRAQRAKKDGKGVVEALDLVVCDAAGERPLAMFSGGERMSVSLALAVGLSRLVARRAGTAIRTLCLDEPDGLDAEARRAFGQALRVLSHRGELDRTVLVSHHDDLAEAADAIYRVTKVDGRSTVEQVA